MPKQSKMFDPITGNIPSYSGPIFQRFFRALRNMNKLNIRRKK